MEHFSDYDYGKELETMSYNTSMSIQLSFQPNSVAAQGKAGFIAGGFGATLRPSLSMPKPCGDVGGMRRDGQSMHYRMERLNGSLVGVALAGYNGTRQIINNRTAWYTEELFINKANKGKLYSRPDGLPLSPPPKRRRRYEKEGGEAAS